MRVCALKGPAQHSNDAEVHDMTCGVLRGFEPAAGFAARPAQPGALRRSGRTVLRWIERSRQRQALAVLERHLLEDIGVTPEDARREAEKPFWQ